ncbi:MAG: DUF1566 domain-containing protein, partial [Gammaproteobacteria bacterium]|nr:DUF1566 domain-containing protein [Gammaproteobacteria bacterium]
MSMFHGRFYYILHGFIVLVLLAWHPQAQAAGPFADNGDGTVTDPSTSLVWQQTDNGVYRTINEAGAYCANLTLGSYSDWRLPEIGELSTLANYDLYDPAIDTVAFPDMPSSLYRFVFSGYSLSYSGFAALTYWSGSAALTHPNKAWWIVSFDSGRVDAYHKDYPKKVPVRCVRGGLESFEPLNNLIVMVIDGVETVTDTSDGLVWQRADDSVLRSWEDASAYCENLVLGGKSDWRLPRIDELKRLLDYGRYSPATDAAVFFGIHSSFYWSGSNDVSDTGTAWGVSFDAGRVYESDKNDTSYVRCVREEPGSFDSSIIAPTASFTAIPNSGKPPLTVALDAGASADDGGIANYAWRSSDGQTASGIAVDLTFNTPGIYAITLTVADDYGAAGAARQTVTAYTDCNAVTEISVGECQSLLDLYNSTNGPDWSDAAYNNWNVTNTPCSWQGVTCSIGGEVIGLSRTNNDLTGTLPDLALPALGYLHLSGNQLTGSIPDFSSLLRLYELRLENNLLSESVPDFSNLPALQD